VTPRMPGMAPAVFVSPKRAEAYLTDMSWWVQYKPASEKLLTPKARVMRATVGTVSRSALAPSRHSVGPYTHNHVDQRSQAATTIPSMNPVSNRNWKNRLDVHLLYSTIYGSHLQRSFSSLLPGVYYILTVP
jgi:hypothetical protein